VTIAFDVLTMGRIGVDIYPLQIGVSLREVRSFGKYLGGSPANVAVAAARYGRTAAVITRTGDDPFGAFVHDALRGYGVDDRYVSAVAGLPTPVTFCESFRRTIFHCISTVSPRHQTWKSGRKSLTRKRSELHRCSG
jgi:5-dehydro-2-deoxygluconokinase